MPAAVKVTAGVLVGEGVIHRVGVDHQPLCRPRTSRCAGHAPAAPGAWCSHLAFLLAAGWCPHCWGQR